MKQVLAVIAAIALIGGAYYLRTEVIAPAPEVGTDTSAPPPADGRDVVCDERLGDACPAGARTLELDEVLDAFATPASTPDVLIAPSLVLDMVLESQRSRASFGDREVLATTTMTLVTFAEVQRAAAQDPCGSSPSWGCIAESIGVELDQLQVGLHDPLSDSDGILALAALTGGLLADSDLPFNTNGLATTDFLSWINGVQQVADTGPAPVEAIIRFNGAMSNSAVVTEAEATRIIASAGNADRLVLRHPQPLAVVSVVVAGVDGAAVGDAADGVGDALRADGWRGPDGRAVADGAPDLPDDDGLPSGGVLVALQQRWR